MILLTIICIALLANINPIVAHHNWPLACYMSEALKSNSKAPIITTNDKENNFVFPNEWGLLRIQPGVSVSLSCPGSAFMNGNLNGASFIVAR